MADPERRFGVPHDELLRLVAWFYRQEQKPHYGLARLPCALRRQVCPAPEEPGRTVDGSSRRSPPHWLREVAAVKRNIARDGRSRLRPARPFGRSLQNEASPPVHGFPARSASRMFEPGRSTGHARRG